MLLPLGGRGKILVTWCPRADRQCCCDAVWAQARQRSGLGYISESGLWGLSASCLPDKHLPASNGAVELNIVRKADMKQGPERNAHDDLRQ